MSADHFLFLALSPWLPAGVVLLLLAVVASLLWSALQRLRLLERRVREAPRTEDLEARLAPVHDSLAGVPGLQTDLDELGRRISALPEPVSAETIRDLQKDLQSLRDAFEESTRRLEALARLVARQDPAAPVVEETWQDRVRRSLETQGYVRVRVLGDLMPEPADDGRFRVGVEARRRGVSYKGAVTVAGGRLAEVALKPAYEAFP